MMMMMNMLESNATPIHVALPVRKNPFTIKTYDMPSSMQWNVSN